MSQTKVAVGMLDATGTPGSGNFLRGDSTWNAPTAGSLVFIQTQTADSAASIDFDAQLSSTYDQYFLVGTDLHLDTNGVQLWMRTDSNGGDSFDSSAGNYCWQNGGTTFASSVATHSGADTKIIICGNNSGTAWGNESDTCGLLYMYINNPSGTTFKKNITGIISYPDADDSSTGQHSTIQFSGQREATAAIDSFQLLPSSGTIDGTIRLYGIADS